jgi:hypothetical protein
LVFYAEVAHLVEHDLAKVGVAGSSPVFRSTIHAGSGGYLHFFSPVAKATGKIAKATGKIAKATGKIAKATGEKAISKR